MINYYIEKIKKNKKLKSLVTSLKNIDDFKRNFILEIYYANKVTSQNILNEITFFAQKEKKRGKRGNPKE